MIAPLRTDCLHHDTQFDPDQFLSMLPLIRRQASIAFRHRNAEARDELIEEVTANAYQAWVRLVQQGKEALAFPTPLAQFAIRQVRAGRRVGSRLNSLDILSGTARRTRGLTVGIARSAGSAVGNAESPTHRRPPRGPGPNGGGPHGYAGVAGHALTKRHRRIAKALALGETTNVVARKFGCKSRSHQSAAVVVSAALGAVSSRAGLGAVIAFRSTEPRLRTRLFYACMQPVDDLPDHV